VLCVYTPSSAWLVVGIETRVLLKEEKCCYVETGIRSCRKLCNGIQDLAILGEVNCSETKCAACNVCGYTSITILTVVTSSGQEQAFVLWEEVDIINIDNQLDATIMVY
jgi:hypothetical protein